jgi:uncharacterized protein (TIGR02246 family)
MLLDTYVKGSRVVGKIRSICLLNGSIVLLHVVGGGAIMAGQSDIDPERNSIQTIVAVKYDDKWLVAAFHNIRAQYLARPRS